MLGFNIKKTIRNWIYRTMEKPDSPIRKCLDLQRENNTFMHSIQPILSDIPKVLNQNSICTTYLQAYHTKTLHYNYSNHFVSYYYESPMGVANLGDYIQTIATERAIRACQGENVCFKSEQRNRLTSHQGGTCVMQGWYEHDQLTFLPGPDTRPVWVGTHFSKDTRELILRLHQNCKIRFSDIGCRDKSTLAFCRSAGISSYFSRCLTLTLPRRTREESEKATMVYIVDCTDEIINHIPEALKKEAKYLTQRNYKFNNWQDWTICRQAAEDRLQEYRKNARLVITTALHCAQPCLAMGIPVVFINPNYDEEERFSSMSGIIPLYSIQDLQEGRIEYPHESPVFEDLKKAMLRNLELSIKESLSDDEYNERQMIREYIESYNVGA